jgi:hypothetical protein
MNIVSTEYRSAELVKIVKSWFITANLQSTDISKNTEKYSEKRRKLLKRLMQIKGFKWNNYSIDLIISDLVANIQPKICRDSVE